MKEIRELEIETFVQATEDSDKVLTAVKTLIPPELHTNGFNLIKQTVRGAFHNPIIIFRLRFTQEAKNILNYIAQHLSELDKQYLSTTLNRRIDKSNFYIRFGKQELYQGKIKIKEVRDMVKVKVGLVRKYTNQTKMMELFQQIGLIL